MFSKASACRKHIRGILYENLGWHGLLCSLSRRPWAVA